MDNLTKINEQIIGILIVVNLIFFVGGFFFSKILIAVAPTNFFLLGVYMIIKKNKDKYYGLIELKKSYNAMDNLLNKFSVNSGGKDGEILRQIQE